MKIKKDVAITLTNGSTIVFKDDGNGETLKGVEHAPKPMFDYSGDVGDADDGRTGVGAGVHDADVHD